MKKHQIPQIELLTALPDYKNADDKYFISEKAIKKIDKFLTGFHLSIGEISEKIANSDFRERFYVFEVIHTNRKVSDLLVAWNIKKIYENNKPFLLLTFYQVLRQSVKIKRWRKLGFKQAHQYKYDVKKQFEAVYFNNSVLNKYTFKIVKGDEIDHTNAAANALNLQYIMYYEYYRAYQIQQANQGETQTTQTIRQPKHFDLHYIKGNEHIKYDRSGTHIIDVISGTEYKSIAECARTHHFDYWEFYRSTKTNKNKRFKRYF